MATYSEVDIAKFYSRLPDWEPDACWLWLAGRDSDGYGRIWIEGKQLAAYRVSYELHCDDIPKGMLVCHTCDTPACCNPKHLFLGTWADNSADMAKKGRVGTLFGAMNGNAKLTEYDVQQIRTLLSQGLSQRRIAVQFNISHATVGNIKHRLRWRRLEAA